MDKRKLQDRDQLRHIAAELQDNSLMAGWARYYARVVELKKAIWQIERHESDRCEDDFFGKLHWELRELVDFPAPVF